MIRSEQRERRGPLRRPPFRRSGADRRGRAQTKEKFPCRRPCPSGGGISGTSGPVSRVLSFKTAIYLGAPLPVRSSRLPGTAGPACMSLHGVAPDRVYSNGRFHTPLGELLPRLSTLTSRAQASGPSPPRKGESRLPPLCRPAKARAFAGPPFGEMRRYISVALVLGSPPAGVTRYPCPVEPGLSSPPGLSPRQRGCPARLQGVLYRSLGKMSMMDRALKGGGSSY